MDDVKRIGYWHDGESERLVIVAEVGRKWITLLCVGDLSAIDIDVYELGRLRQNFAGQVRPKRLAAILEAGLQVEGRRVRATLVADVLRQIRRDPKAFTAN